MNKSQNITKLIGYSRSGILSKDLVRAETSNATLFCMSKGTEMSEHTSTKQGYVYVLEGKGVFTLKGEKIARAPGVLIFMKKNAGHSIKADENTSFLLFLY